MEKNMKIRIIFLCIILISSCATKRVIHRKTRYHNGMVDPVVARKKYNSNDNMVLADNFAADRDYPNAILFYGKVIGENPRRPYVYEKRASCYIEIEEVDKAIADWKQAIIYYPDRKPIIYSFANYCKLSQNPKIQAFINNSPQSLSKIRDKHWKHELIRGNVCMELGKYKEAINAYTQTIKQNPRLSQAYQLRGVAYLVTGQKEKASKDMEKAKENEHLAKGLSTYIPSKIDSVEVQPNKVYSIKTTNWNHTRVPILDFVVQGFQGLTRFVMYPITGRRYRRYTIYKQYYNNLDITRISASSDIWEKDQLIYRIFHP